MKHHTCNALNAGLKKKEEDLVIQPILVSKFVLKLSFSILNNSTLDNRLRFSILKYSTVERQLFLIPRGRCQIGNFAFLDAVFCIISSIASYGTLLSAKWSSNDRLEHVDSNRLARIRIKLTAPVAHFFCQLRYFCHEHAAVKLRIKTCSRPNNGEG